LPDVATKKRWRDRANKVRLLLDGAVKKIDRELTAKVKLEGPLELAGEVWSLDSAWQTEIDLPALHRAMGTAFYDVVSTSKTRVEERVLEWDASSLAEVRACFRSVPVGTKVVKRKVGADG
jgi:hypothetical protein